MYKHLTAGHYQSQMDPANVSFRSKESKRVRTLYGADIDVSTAPALMVAHLPFSAVLVCAAYVAEPSI